MKRWDKQLQIFTWLFLSTGIFAIVGALFTWGEGFIWEQSDERIRLIPWADLIVAGPISLITAYGLWKKRGWGISLGCMTCGVYLFGSVLVYVQVIGHGPPYPLRLLLPPVFGIGIVIAFMKGFLNRDQQER